MPETVLPLPDGTLLVSNVCGYREQDTGFLTLLSAKGEVLDWRIVSNLDSPLGMALQADRWSFWMKAISPERMGLAYAMENSTLAASGFGG